jgi:Fuc2NAc and GlcNAc transferase
VRLRWIALGISAAVASFLLTLLLERTARATGLIDVPNERSSHTTPTPRGGGLAIVIASLALMALLLTAGLLPPPLFVGLAGGGAAVALVGFVDDRRPLSPGIRLLVHFLAAAWAVAWVGRIQILTEGQRTLASGSVNFALCTVGIVWFLNSFNFMDGIDGIAASEAILVCAGISLFAGFLAANTGIAAAAIAVGAAALGFLPRNWPGARIFMGDVGSGYLGFAVAVLGLACAVQRPAAAWGWLILVGVFAMDSTITLLRRLARGEPLTVAHRTHAYQRLARRLGHRKVTMAVIIIDLLWLMPCAYLSLVRPAEAIWITLGALFPLAVFVLRAGAGRANDAEKDPTVIG